MKSRKSRGRGSLKKKGKFACPRPERSPELVIITGMSGSGKASVLKAFEDLGYYCVDNLPVELIPQFAELAVQSSEIRRTALVVDVREGSKLEQLPGILKSVRRMIPTKVVFLEASDAVLLRRFSETRRPHPLGTDSPVKSALKAERRHLGSHSPPRRFRHRHLEVQRSRTSRSHHRAFSGAVLGKEHSGLVRELRIPPGRARRRRPGLRRPLPAQPALRAGVPAADRSRSAASPSTFARFRRRTNSSRASPTCWSICCRTTSTKARVI